MPGSRGRPHRRSGPAGQPAINTALKWLRSDSQGDDNPKGTMVLPAVGRHETRTGEMPMELITVSHPDSSLLGGRGANKAKDYAADAAVADAGVKACICIWREVHLQQHR